MSDPQIYVNGFRRNTRQSQLKDIFSKFGDIRQVRLFKEYAFAYKDEDASKKAVEQMNGKEVDGRALKVEIAGKPRRSRGPQADDECRFCKKLGHWQKYHNLRKNDCPEFRRQKKKRKKRRHSSSSDSSSSSDESSRRHKKKKKSKKIQKKHHRKSPSSSSSSNYSSSSNSRQIISEKES